MLGTVVIQRISTEEVVAIRILLHSILYADKRGGIKL